MAKQRSSRGLTRADALVTGLVCSAAVFLVPVVQAMTREHYIRTVCADNLSQIGRVMLIYADDYEDELPRAGGPTSAWGPVANWTAANRYMAYGLAADGSGGKATINSCFFLLVKYYQAPTRLFLCRGDEGTSEFKLSDVSGLASNFELVDAWDFGPPSTSVRSCSFSYHLPFRSSYALTTSRDPNMAVAADRNPWMASPASCASTWAYFKPDLPGCFGTAEMACQGNAIAHGQNGQNVLFLDGRVTFETRSYCGVELDNIYTIGTVAGGAPWGTMPTLASVPLSEQDSLLLHDPNTFGPYRK